MSTHETDLARKIAEVDRYVGVLHLILDNFVQRVRSIEAITGTGPESLNYSLEWRVGVEASLAIMIEDHDWHWQEQEKLEDRIKGDVVYRQILKLSELLPIDATMAIWANTTAEIPNNLPLIWSDPTTTTGSQSPGTFSDMEDGELAKHLGKINKQ